MEKNLKIPLGENKFIYGTLLGKINNPLIIFVHGFVGEKNHHIFFNGAKFFLKHNFSTFRFNFYGQEDDTKQLNECSISTHVSDLDTVVSYFRNISTKVYVVGHSFGGLITLLSKKQEFDKAVLWDPSSDTKSWLVKDAKYVNEIGLYYFVDWGISYTIGKGMFEECVKLKTNKLSSKFHKPLKIIAAGNGILINGAKRYFEQANQPKKFSVINGVGHNFDEIGAEEKLLKETLNFLK